MGGEKKERFQEASIKPEDCSEDFTGVNPYGRTKQRRIDGSHR
jgi:hypothetical protein